MSLVVIEAVVTPIRSVRQRTGYESRKLVFIEFSLEESAFLQHVSVIVAVNHIAHA